MHFLSLNNNEFIGCLYSLPAHEDSFISDPLTALECNILFTALFVFCRWLSAEISCPSTYIPFGRYCYKYHSQPINKHYARAICTREGAHLADIESQSENNFIRGLILPGVSSIMIGYSRIGSLPTDFVMDRTGLPPSQAMMWQSGQPDNLNAQEYCVRYITATRRWDDISCSTLLPFVCKKGKLITKILFCRRSPVDHDFKTKWTGEHQLIRLLWNSLIAFQPECTWFSEHFYDWFR